MEKKEQARRGKYVSRSVYQKVCEENKKLMADLKILVFDMEPVNAMLVRRKWREHFRTEADFNSMMKSYATQYFKDHPELDIAAKLN